MINRILPLLNRIVPNNISFKGLQKLDPRIGRFLNIAGAAYGADAAVDFLRNKFQGDSQTNTSQMRPEEAAAQAQIANSRELPNFLMGTGKALAGGAGLASIGAQALDTLGSTDDQIQKGVFQDPIQVFQETYPDIASALARTIQNGQNPEAAAAILKQSTAFSKEIKKLEKEIGKNFVDYVLELFGPTPKPTLGQQQPQQGAQPQMGQQIMQGQQPPGNMDQEILAALDKILKM